MTEAKDKGYSRIEFWTQDESRCGLMPITRHRITAKGIQPIISGEYNFENFYLYGMTQILTGERFILELPTVNGECFKLFLKEFVKEKGADKFHLVFLDNASFHSEDCVTLYENMAFINFPAYSPELNPIERFWRDLKDWLSTKCPKSLDELSDLIMEKLKSYTNDAVKSLTGYKYLVTACEHAIA